MIDIAVTAAFFIVSLISFGERKSITVSLNYLGRDYQTQFIRTNY